MEERIHPVLGIRVREDGSVLVPGGPRHKEHWTFGYTKNNGYKFVQINKKLYTVHRLVAEAFLPNPESLPTVDHFPDRTRTNNAVSNLRWASYTTQLRNTSQYDRCAQKYGVHWCDDKTAYLRAWRRSKKEQV